jgi:ATP-dependent RNA helicase SUPV3L1/SUV3
MMSILGCGEEDLTLILRSIGFRDATEKKEDGSDVIVWKQRNRRDEREQHKRVERKPFRKPRPDGQRADAPRPEAQRTEGPRTDTPRPEGERQAKGPRPDKGPRKEQRPPHGKQQRDEQRGERQGDQRPKSEQRPEARREKPFKVDPDSPFAALAALKFRK